MWPLGHAAVGYLCYSLAAERDWLPPLNFGVLVALAVGTQLPDLIDKPLAWYLAVLPSGRSFAHSLFFLAAVAVVALWLGSRLGHRAVAVALVFGAVSHTIVDALPVLWDSGAVWEFLLYPVYDDYYEPDASYTFFGLLRAQATNPYFVGQHLLAVVALARWWVEGAPGLDVVHRLREMASPTAGS